ncbi:MAG: hypothetical protein CM1200mP10_06260 [Candidatus Neomarinimicrobiota bacterium]|nr:MAG: hypothetical protein CM1200mP10_06260 [Candidatus Neomarinimicrobiota bacterium]
MINGFNKFYFLISGKLKWQTLHYLFVDDRKDVLTVVIGVIPARLHSKRFPNKILAPINDKPMVMHVYDRAKEADKLDDVIIALTVMKLRKH